MSSSSAKRPKTEHDDTKLDCRSPPPLSLSAPHGVERIRLPPSLNVRRLSSYSLERLVAERTKTLRTQGRRVVGLPVVLDDGIVLNWVRDKLGSLHEASDLPVVVRQTPTSFTKHKNEKLHLPLVSTGGGSGTSAADAVIIDSDEDMNNVSSLASRQLPASISLNDSYIELLPPIRAESKVDDNAPSSNSPLPRELSIEDGITSSGPPSTRASTKDENAVTTDMSTSDSEDDGTDEEMNAAEDTGGGGISVRHAEPPPSTSLQPIRDLLAGRKRRGVPTCDVLQNATIVASRVSQKQRRRESPEVPPAITGSEVDKKLGFQASDPQLKRVPLPKTDFGRARRLLVPDSADLPLVAVTMRGDCHFIERKKKYRITGYSLPNPGKFRHVTDVCMVGDTAVLGCANGTDQVSFLSVAGKPQMINVTRSPHSSGPRYQDTQRRGVSCLAAIHAKSGHIKFLSGGYDGTVHDWMAGVENMDEPRSRKVVSHGACIMALAYCDRDGSVVASAQKRLHITDLNRCKTMVHPFSNDVQQIHIHPQAAYVTLLEVRHLDHQIQLYDSRKANFNGAPCLSFGHRNTDSKFPAMRTRGSVHLVHFAKASDDGYVLLWDFRNIKRAVVERRFLQAEKVVHTIFADSDIATFGQGVVTFFEDYLT